MGRLTTHVLDTAIGKPGAGIAVAVFRLEGSQRKLLSSIITNSDGRCDHALLEGSSLVSGVHELVFDMANYFRKMGYHLQEPPFVGEVVLRFGIGDASQHYHVPLLVSPWSYSTYRGS